MNKITITKQAQTEEKEGVTFLIQFENNPDRSDKERAEDMLRKEMKNYPNWTPHSAWGGLWDLNFSEEKGYYDYIFCYQCKSSCCVDRYSIKE